jgi:hypothetical protein
MGIDRIYLRGNFFNWFYYLAGTPHILELTMTNKEKEQIVKMLLSLPRETMEGIAITNLRRALNPEKSGSSFFKEIEPPLKKRGTR